jgi:BASS family bile acid:Na+ symporter
MLLAVYYPTAWLVPDYGLATLVLAGVSTGVVAPVLLGVMGGNMALALVMTVSTSLILSLMVQLTAGRALDFDLGDMAVFLRLIIFMPLLTAGLTRHFLSRITKVLSGASFSASIILIFLTNTAIFGKYAVFIQY